MQSRLAVFPALSAGGKYELVLWDAYLRRDAEAGKWLDGDGPGLVLEEGDRWQKK